MINLRKTLDMIGWTYCLPLSIGGIAHERPLSLNALVEKLCLMTWTPPAAATSPLPPMPDSSVADDPEKLYISLKQVEDKFPFPTPVKVLFAGDFFPGEGVPEDWPDSMAGLPVHWKGAHILGDINAENIAVNFVLRYYYHSEPDQDFATFDAKLLGASTSPEGKELPVPPLPPALRVGNSLFLNVGGRTYPLDFGVAVELSAGAVKTQTGHVIGRPQLLAMGAYTLPLVPIAVLYEPPQDLNKQNTVTYTDTKSVGATIQTSVSTEDSKTVPESLGFVDVNTISSGMQGIGKGLEAVGEKSGNGWFKAFGIVVEALASLLLGSHTATRTDDNKVQNDHTVTWECSDTDIIYPTLHKGPGLGDCIIMRTNVRVAWMADPDGGITLYVLPGSRLTAFTVDSLLSDPQKSGLDPGTIQALLNLDPFAAGGPDADLPQPRFCKEKSWQINYGADVGYTASHEITEEDMTTSVSFTTHAEDQSPGLLSFLGIGVTEEKHTKHTLTVWLT
jgi:hypothetical protein